MNGAPSGLLLPEVLQKLGTLTLRARRIVEGALTGLHRSPHHGASIEFAEHKEYAPGDDIRHIDWKAYGRFDKYYVKKFEQETNLQGYLLVDGSGSMEYKGEDSTWSKREYACVLAASLAYLLIRQQDSAGLLTFSDGPDEFVPPRATSAHLRYITQALEALRGEGGTDIVRALDHIAELGRRRSTVIVLSDLFDTSPLLLDRLKRIRARGNDVAVFHILDPWELTFPFESLTEFEDLEDPERRIVADPRGMRDAYLEEMNQFVSGVQKSCREGDVDCITVSTDQPPDRVLIRFLAARLRR